jgi:hypothetical protein
MPYMATFRRFVYEVPWPPGRGKASDGRLCEYTHLPAGRHTANEAEVRVTNTNSELDLNFDQCRDHFPIAPRLADQRMAASDPRRNQLQSNGEDLSPH